MNIKKPTFNIIDRSVKKSSSENISNSTHENYIKKWNITKNALTNMKVHLAVVDDDGILTSVNIPSSYFPVADGPFHVSESSIGLNYFDLCREDFSDEDKSTLHILTQIISVVNRQQTNFTSLYTCQCLEEEKSFLINVFRPGDDATKVVITHQHIAKENKDQNTSAQMTTDIKCTLAEQNALLDSSLDIICTINRDGNFVTINQASKTLLGYSSTEVIGNNITKFLIEKDIEQTATAFEKITNGNHIPVFENRCVHKNGKLIPFLWSINYDENLKMLCCVGKDVTERKKLEKAIKNERDQFYNIFQSAPSAIGMLKGSNYIFEMVNPLYLKLIGKKNIIGKTIAEVLPEVVEQGFIKILDHVYNSGEAYTGSEVLTKVDSKNDGELNILYTDFVYQAYRNSAGEVDGIFFFINDITEQVESKKKIQTSEKQYRQIVETAQEGIWVIDKNSRTIFVNKKICETFGYTEKEIIGKKNTYFMNKESKKEALLALERRKKGNSEKLELTFISKKGENILASISATPIFDDAANFTGALGMLSNITEKRHLENLLEKSNRLARIGSWEIDVVRGTVFWSDITKEIREVDADFIPDLKTGIGFFTEGVSKTLISERLKKCIDHGTPWDEELELTTFKGNLKWVRTIGEAVIVNGKCTKIYGSFQDITERKNAAEKVVRSESRLNIAQLIAQVGSWEIDVKTNDQSWSAEFYRILEIDENITPSSEALLPLIHREDRANAIKTMSDAFPNQKDSSFDFRFLRKNGEIGHASSEWRFEFDSYGNPLYIYGILRDLTEEKKAESERAKMISDITQRNKDLEQFSYIISHNLRSPVANIIGITEELKDETHSAESKLLLAEALSSDVKRLENVIVDLNTILQTKREINELKEKVNLSELVDNIKLSINDLIQRRGVVITSDFSEIDDVIFIKSYIHSIFYNLISNSIKYRQSDCDALIEIKSHYIDGQIVLTFKDNGRGIDLKAKGDQIFGLYKRFHSDTEGKGMGLYMVKTQVEALGGKISVVSEVDHGSTFTIEFENNPYI